MTAQDTTARELLHPFLEAEGGFVSGEKLARRAGVSRVSIWNRMNKLETEGFRFEAIRNRGYRLLKEPSSLHPLLLEAYAHKYNLNIPLHIFPTIDSTSNEVERRLIGGETTPFAVAAGEQTKGRGRLGRTWESAPVGNLYLSLAFHPTLKRDRMQTFTLWMGVNLVNRLRTLSGLPITIKWPNDVLCRGRKLAGMLTEARVDNDRLKDLIFGLGLNVNAETFPSGLEDKATSLRLESGNPHSIHRITVEVLQSLIQAYEDIDSRDITRELQEQWGAIDCLNGKAISIKNGNQDVTGIAMGIDTSGCLKIRTGDEQTVNIRAGDVTLTNQYES